MAMTEREIFAFVDAHLLVSSDNTILPSLLNNIGEKLRADLYKTVMAAWLTSEMSLADLSARSGVSEKKLTILLIGPSKWHIETAAQLLFAINGHLIQPTTIGAMHLSPPNKGV